MPEPWDTVVILFLLTPGSLADPVLIDYARQALARDLPVVPVAEDLATYHFEDIPPSCDFLGALNATGFEPGAGQAITETVRGYLGVESFAREKKVFISYRRSDAQPVADEVFHYLRDEHFWTFLDRYQIEVGAPVQSRIMSELADMDFVLLIDSEDAAHSKWVMAEITEALRLRIPVCRLCIHGESFFPLYRDARRFDWYAGDPSRLNKLKLLISRGIASRRTFDQRVQRTVAAVLGQVHGTHMVLARRQMILAADGREALLEYEDAPVSLERLHRLYLNLQSRIGCSAAVLAAGDSPVPKVTTDAVNWARGTHPLQAVSLVGVYKALLDALH